jgi:hypothetical protein
MMALTIRQKRITKLFRFVSGEEKAGLVSRQSPLKRRMKCAVLLSRLLVGRNQVIKLRRLIREIEAAVKADFDSSRTSATEVQSISKLAAAAYEKLAEADRDRQMRNKKLTQAEEDKLLADARAKEPFLAPEGCVWYPPKTLTDGRAIWLLGAPVFFQVMERREFNEKLKSRSVGS